MIDETHGQPARLHAEVGLDLPIWWNDYLSMVERFFVPDANPDDVQRAKNEMTAAARAALAEHEQFLRCLGLRQPGEQDSFVAWARGNGYDTWCIGPRYVSQRTKDAERGWMARAHSGLWSNEQLQPSERSAAK